MQLRSRLRLPRIPVVIRRRNLRRLLLAEPQQRPHVQMEVPRREGRKILYREPKKAVAPRAQPAPVLGMRRMQILLLEMHECPRHLDEPLEEEKMLVAPFQPQVFQHIVRFMAVLPRIENT